MRTELDAHQRRIHQVLGQESGLQLVAANDHLSVLENAGQHGHEIQKFWNVRQFPIGLSHDAWVYSRQRLNPLPAAAAAESVWHFSALSHSAGLYRATDIIRASMNWTICGIDMVCCADHFGSELRSHLRMDQQDGVAVEIEKPSLPAREASDVDGWSTEADEATMEKMVDAWRQ